MVRWCLLDSSTVEVRPAVDKKTGEGLKARKAYRC
jgi:hypothetical protein